MFVLKHDVSRTWMDWECFGPRALIVKFVAEHEKVNLSNLFPTIKMFKSINEDKLIIDKHNNYCQSH